MMQTKLTLRLDERLIASAKAYAQQHGKSVSQLVADYFAALDRTKSAGAIEENAPASYAPVTRSLIGVLGHNGDRSEYHAYLEQKHL
ncbi:MAG: DUF6364 family protein [Caldilinea sp.]